MGGDYGNLSMRGAWFSRRSSSKFLEYCKSRKQRGLETSGQWVSMRSCWLELFSSYCSWCNLPNDFFMNCTSIRRIFSIAEWWLKKWMSIDFLSVLPSMAGYVVLTIVESVESPMGPHQQSFFFLRHRISKQMHHAVKERMTCAPCREENQHAWPSVALVTVLVSIVDNFVVRWFPDCFSEYDFEMCEHDSANEGESHCLWHPDSFEIH